MRDAANSEKDVVGVDPTASSAGHDSKMVDSMLQTVLDCFSQWLRQGHCDGFARGTPAANALATRARRLESSPGFAGVLGAAKAFCGSTLPRKLWPCSQMLNGCVVLAFTGAWTTAVSGQEYVGLRNLGNSCYLNAVVQCFYSCGPLREDVSRQSPAKGPLASCMQRLFLQLSGENGHWDYVSLQPCCTSCFSLTALPFSRASLPMYWSAAVCCSTPVCCARDCLWSLTSAKAGRASAKRFCCQLQEPILFIHALLLLQFRRC